MNKFQPDKKRKTKEKKIRLLFCCCAMDITLIQAHSNVIVG
jgi:hypothetical protein